MATAITNTTVLAVPSNFTMCAAGCDVTSDALMIADDFVAGYGDITLTVSGSDGHPITYDWRTGTLDVDSMDYITVRKAKGVTVDNPAGGAGATVQLDLPSTPIF